MRNLLEIRRRQLDRQLDSYREMTQASGSAKGWVRAIREGLGLSGVQLAKRLRVSPASVSELEKGEVARTVSLATLEKAAHAMGCRLVYALVPEKRLEETVQDRARFVAGRRMAQVSQTMRLENQELDAETQRWTFEQLTRKLATDDIRTLWREDD